MKKILLASTLIFIGTLSTITFAKCGTSQVTIVNSLNQGIYFSEFNPETNWPRPQPVTANCGNCGGTTIGAGQSYTFSLISFPALLNNYVKMEFDSLSNEYIGKVEVGNDNYSLINDTSAEKGYTINVTANSVNCPGPYFQNGAFFNQITVSILPE